MTASMDRTVVPVEPVQELEKVLKEQLSLYEQYAVHLKGDAQLMAQLKIEDLEKSNKAKNTLLLKIQTIDQARMNWVKQIANRYGLSEERVKIDEICKALGAGSVADRLLALRDRLHSTIASLKTVQDDTKILAQTSLSWINGSMLQLKSLLTPTGTYNPQGRVEHQGMFAGRVVEREA